MIDYASAELRALAYAHRGCFPVAYGFSYRMKPSKRRASKARVRNRRALARWRSARNSEAFRKYVFTYMGVAIRDALQAKLVQEPFSSRILGKPLLDECINYPG